MNLHAHLQGRGNARLTFFSVERFVWVSGWRAFGVLRVFLFLILDKSFPLCLYAFYKTFPLFIKKKEHMF